MSGPQRPGKGKPDGQEPGEGERDHPEPGDGPGDGSLGSERRSDWRGSDWDGAVSRWLRSLTGASRIKPASPQFVRFLTGASRIAGIWDGGRLVLDRRHRPPD